MGELVLGAKGGKTCNWCSALPIVGNIHCARRWRDVSGAKRSSHEICANGDKNLSTSLSAGEYSIDAV